MKPIINPYKKKNQVGTQVHTGDKETASVAAGIKRPASQISTVTPDHRAHTSVAASTNDDNHHSNHSSRHPPARRNLLTSLNYVAVGNPPQDSVHNNSSLAIRPTLTPGWCLARCSGNSGTPLRQDCRCVRARIQSRCAACGNAVHVGHCIQREGAAGGGWAHVRCQQREDDDDNNDRGTVRSLYKEFRPLISSQEQRQEQLEWKKNSASVVTPNSSQYQDSVPGRPSARSQLSYNPEQRQAREDSSFGLTEEQKAILAHSPNRGDLIRIKARAGTGKTTTVAFLCHELLARDPRQRILYVIFAAHGSLEAKQSGKFPKNVAIMTSHAYALKCLALERLSPKNSNYSKQNVARLLQLQHWVHQTFGLLGSVRKMKQRAITIAGYIIKTLENFQHSEDTHVREEHVFWRATLPGVSPKSEWRSKIRTSHYVQWAQTVFDSVWHFLQEYAQDYRMRIPTHVEITHDGYLKVFQLERLHSRVGMQCDVVIVDESQDMNACQACVLWGLATRMNNQPTVYMVGDDRQRLFRFRGASQQFEMSSPNMEFHLTGSFRFGETIGRLATMILQQDEHSIDSVEGLAQQCGSVLPAEKFHRGVVICRTNNGIYHYLQEARPKKWALFSSDTASPLSYLKDLNRLQSFMAGESQTYTFDGEEFHSFDELKDFCSETHQQDMMNQIAMMEKYQEENTDIAGLFENLISTFVRDWRSQCHSIDDFDGVVLLTCHKAKGLEFNDVLVYDDFRFDEIMKLNRLSLLASSFSREMLDLVYVAVTRTKERLYLCKEGLEYMEWLEKQSSDDHAPRNANGASSSPLGEAEEKCPADLRECAERSWCRFTEMGGHIDSVAQIPWPLGPKDNPFCFEPSMTRTEQLKICRAALLRYHPDKFFQFFSTRLNLSPEDRDKLKNKLHCVTDQANSFWKSLRE